MLQAANIDLLNNSVSKSTISFTNEARKSLLKLVLRIFIFCTLASALMG